MLLFVFLQYKPNRVFCPRFGIKKIPSSAGADCRTRFVEREPQRFAAFGRRKVRAMAKAKEYRGAFIAHAEHHRDYFVYRYSLQPGPRVTPGNQGGDRQKRRWTEAGS